MTAVKYSGRYNARISFVHSNEKWLGEIYDGPGKYFNVVFSIDSEVLEEVINCLEDKLDLYNEKDAWLRGYKFPDGWNTQE